MHSHPPTSQEYHSLKLFLKTPKGNKFNQMRTEELQERKIREVAQDKIQGISIKAV